MRSKSQRNVGKYCIKYIRYSSHLGLVGRERVTITGIARLECDIRRRIDFQVSLNDLLFISDLILYQRAQRTYIIRLQGRHPACYKEVLANHTVLPRFSILFFLPSLQSARDICNNISIRLVPDLQQNPALLHLYPTDS